MGRRAVLAALVGVFLVAAPAAAANAAPGGVEVSPDGVHYSSNYSGALFTDIDHLVPGDSDTAIFYLRNSATEPGFLRITLRDVVTSNADFANALSMQASTFGHQGDRKSTRLNSSHVRISY